MNNLERAALQAILNKVMDAKYNYDLSNNKNIPKSSENLHWGNALEDINEAIDLLKMAIKK